MATHERLIALKKAYADILLNTAKEAADKIRASERKAQRFEQELQLSKDEALNTAKEAADKIRASERKAQRFEQELQLSKDEALNTAKEAADKIMASERKAQRFEQELQLSKDEALNTAKEAANKIRASERKAQGFKRELQLCKDEALNAAKEAADKVRASESKAQGFKRELQLCKDEALNAAKEADDKIRASESKAQGFERELQLCKDEALRMMLRLKQMMDAKIAVAQAMSMSQKKKIHDLEAQIADAQAMSMSQKNKIHELEAQLQEAEDIVKDLREELREVQSELRHMRNKKQYSNEQNVFQYTSSAVFPSNALINTQFQRNELFRFYTPAPPVSNLYKGIPALPSIISRNKELERYINRCTQRIPSSEGNLLNTELPGSRKSVLKDISNGELLSKSSNKMGNSDKVIEKETNSQVGVSSPVLSFCTTKKPVSRHTKKFRSDQAAEVSNTTSHPISARSDTDADVNPSSASRLSECGMETTGNGKAFTHERNLAVSAGAQNPVNGNTAVMPMQKISVSVHTKEAEKLDILSPLSEINGSVGGAVQRQPVNETVINSTFQRKRKRELLSHPEKNASKRPANVPVYKLNLVPGSRPESQRLASQVLMPSEMVER